MSENKSAKSLRWVANQIPDFEPTTDDEKMLLTIKRYSTAGAMEIEQLQAENAELRERLSSAVELKAKVGDCIYLPWQYDGTFAVATLLIISIDFRYNGEFAYSTNLQSDSAIFLAKYKYGTFSNEDFDSIVFTDRTAAEKKLEEMKNNVY